MLFKFLITTYTKYKTILFMSLVFTVLSTNVYVDEYIIEQITPTEDGNGNGSHKSGIHTCFRNNSVEDVSTKDQNTLFEWTENELSAVKSVSGMSPIVNMLYGGILSDKFGGHIMVFVGLVLCTLPMSTLYLSIFKETYLFIVMVIVRGSGLGIIWVAMQSLEGKLAPCNQTTIVVSTVGAGWWVGYLLANTIISKNVDNWMTLSQITGFVSFVTAIWWWMICRHPQFPRVRRMSRIPWKDILTSVSFYVICMSITAYHFHYIILFITITIYSKKVIYLKEKAAGTFIYGLSGVFSLLACGITTDFMINKGYLSASAARRFFVGLSIVMLFCTLIVLKLAECDQLLTLACFNALLFSNSFGIVSTVAASIEFSPLYTGTVMGIACTIGHTMAYYVYDTLEDIFIYNGEFSGDVSRRSLLFFALLAFFVLVLYLPFLCFGIKRTSWGIDESRRRIRPITRDDNLNQL